MKTITHYTFFFLSVRDPVTDFRRDLVAALRQLGHEVTYIRLARQCFVDGPEPDVVQSCNPVIIAARMLRACLKGRKVVVFNTVNLGFPVFCTLLRIATWRAVWCFDIHDDLLYELSGFGRVIGRAKLAWFQAIASFSVRAAPTLSELFPMSRSLCNASSIKRICRNGFDPSSVLILSNIDARLDFALLEAILQRNPTIAFHIYGAIARDVVNQAAFSNLRAFPNLMYHGPYINVEITSILAKYDLTLAPYRLAHCTRYIDPLRFYHCLNNGIEIVTTSIPRALDMRDSLHIISSAEEFCALIDGLLRGTVEYKNRKDCAPITWASRASELEALVTESRAEH
jgi:hypothetical protein